MKKWVAMLGLAGAAGFLIWRSGSRVDEVKRGLSSITVPDGFEVALAAKPGLMSYPMLGTIAPDGVIYMCESSGKTVKTPEMTADPTYVVTRLEDIDKDGVYDKSTVFAEKLTLPAGAVWYRGSVYVAAPPQVYRLQDTNGDGVADVKEVVVEGWNLSANAASLHGPIMGPDGWLYLTDGRHGFKITTKDGRKYQGRGSRIWRVRPDGTGLEPYAGGGFDNPVEVAFTEGGDMFGTMTYFQDPRDGQRDAILHFVEGGVYPKPHPTTVEFQRTGDLMPVMTKFARIAPSGLERYRGVALGAEFRGNLFSAQFNAHRVQRHVVRPEGATYRTEDSDFFVSSDPDLHPTDVVEDADGSLIVVDTGAWFIHGCPLSRVAKPDVRGALYRVRKKGARAEDPRGEKLRIAEKSAGELVTLLEDARPVVRDRATERLVEMGEGSVEALAGKSGSSAAVFALSRIGGGKALRAMRRSLTDSNADVRQAAARMLGMARDAESVPQLLEMARKEDPRVRRQAVAALGQIGDKRALSALLDAAANPEDRFVEHSIIYSLIQLRDAAALMTKLTDASVRVRKAALIALDQMESSPLREQQVMPFLEDPDPGLRRTAFWVVSRHAPWSAKLAQMLDARVRGAQFSREEAEMLGEAMATFCGDASMKNSIGGALGDPALDAERQVFLLETAERCSVKEFPAEWRSGLERLLRHKDAKVRVQAVNLVRARGVDWLDVDLRRLADSAAEPDDVRIAALSALGSRQRKLSDKDFAYLTGRLAPAVDAAAKLAAGQVLARAEFTDEQLIAVAQVHFQKADPVVLPNLLEAFRHNRNEYVGQALIRGLRSVEESLGAVGSQRVQELVGNYPEPVRQAARPILERLEASRKERLGKLKTMEGALGGGDVARGKELFFGAKAGCSSCHTIGLDGGHVGPDLTSIGAIRSPHDLLEAIVLPSESFVPGHEVYRVVTEREIYSGVMGRSTPEAVRLITGPGDEVRIPRKEIKKMEHAPVSLMPEGFDEILTRQEMRDLIAYLRAQKQRPEGRGD